MHKEIKDKWVAALRSGKYQKGKGYLKVDDSFCCLGVLCELSQLSEFKKCKTLDTPHEHWRYGIPEEQHQACYLPKSVRDWAGITEPVLDLIIMNDSEGTTFDQIADTIEKTWEKL